MKIPRQSMKSLWYYCISMTLLVLFIGTVCQGENHIPVEAGKQITDFSLKDFNGEEFSLSAELDRNKAILLWFTNLCGGCQVKLTEMEKIKDAYEKDGVSIIAISVLGKDRETIERVIKEKEINLRFLYDPEGNVTELFSGKYYPGTCPLKNLFIIGKKREIMYATHYPGVEESEIKTHFDKIVGGER